MRRRPLAGDCVVVGRKTGTVNNCRRAGRGTDCTVFYHDGSSDRYVSPSSMRHCGSMNGLAGYSRQHVGVERTLLCATRFWGGGVYDPSHGPGWYKTRWERGEMPHGTLLKGVKHVVRKQGFTTATIDKALRKLERLGAIEVGGGPHAKTIRLTAKGGKVACATVKLAPWTNDEYPGSQLSGRRRRRR